MRKGDDDGSGIAAGDGPRLLDMSYGGQIACLVALSSGCGELYLLCISLNKDLCFQEKGTKGLLFMESQRVYNSRSPKVNVSCSSLLNKTSLACLNSDSVYGTWR